MQFIRVIGLIVGLFLMAGFGICSLFGLTIAVDSTRAGAGSGGMVLLLALGGLVLCGLLGWGVYKLFKQITAPRLPK